MSRHFRAETPYGPQAYKGKAVCPSARVPQWPEAGLLKLGLESPETTTQNIQFSYLGENT